ncbi:tripartite tricarboxylate transporter substrate binding protein [Ornithinicoccus halotolerans]|uniref:tripartite tricarboxylate transporter substrate binding protein n=1 Tax=Ornithinicoccus halotolerans TaxID=1748220 RepID=UPI0012978DE7|nr:tripartite tricarboxylate transporter substrate binding protein [Ornithinicoccus halotolerans]
MTLRTSTRTRALAGALTGGALLLAACGNGGGDGGSDSGETGGGGGEGGGFQPSGTVTMIVPFAAGGGSDIAGRATASGFESVSDATISVTNIEGGSGAVGYSNFLGENGNPNTLLATETALIALPITQDVEFSYEDFTPIMMLGEDYTLIVAREDSPLQTCADLVEKAESERTVVAISGETGLDNVVFSLMEEETGVEFDRVPFESGAELLTALLGGEVDAISVNPGEVSGQIESGDVRPLCAAAEERYDYELLADVETAAEQGIDVSFAQFRGVLAPGGITEEERDYWIGVGQDFAESEEYTTYIEDNMLQPNTAFGDDFTAVLSENHEKLSSIIDGS